MVASPEAWAEPFLNQAREDLRAAWTIDRSEAASTFCMLMQMVFEKLAKAAYARSGNHIPRSHRISSHLLLVLKRHPAGREIPQANAQVLGFIVELELAHPSSARLQPQPFPQLEYPWEDPEAGKILYPARDLPLAKRITDPQDRIASDLLKLASALANRFDEIFPE